jgi:phosphoribosylanthranilate isomerase
MPVRVKICGITNVTDAEQAASLGADAVGLNFYAKSPRCIDAAMTRLILNVLPPFVEPVGLFVNEPLVDAQRTAQALTLRTIQVYGDHHEILPVGCVRWIPAFSVKDAADLQHITSYLENLKFAGAVPAAILVDAHVPGQYGGTGQIAPWQLVADFKPGVPLILAGGLTPDNVANAIRIVCPYAVDVASGVESSPGKKDPDMMRRFIDAVRSV